MSPVFRTATASDVAAVVELVESAYRGDASRAGWTTEADLLGGQRTDRHEVQALVGDPAATLRLAFIPRGDSRGATASKASDPDGLLGCVLVRSEGAHAHVGMFAVRPTLQSRGLGRALLAEANASPESGAPAAQR